MYEFAVLSVEWLVIVALLTRRGADRLSKPWVIGVFAGWGAQTGAFLEMMPFTHVHGAFSLRTVVACMIGVFAMRLIGRGVHAWAAGYRDEDRGALRKEARLLHPVIALGLAISGALVLHEGCAARHLALEIERTPRDTETGIVKGAEPVRLETPGATRAVLLLHGFLGSPRDLGDLPTALHDAGLTVSAPLVRGCGTTPRDLLATGPDDWLAGALEDYDALAATHAEVDVVGFSAGGYLALRLAAERPVHRLVLVNPYVGVTFTPSWLPFSTDALQEFVEPLIEYVMRSDAFVRLRDRSRMGELRAYRSVPVAASAKLHRAAAADVEPGLLRKIAAPVLLVQSDEDRAAPADIGQERLAPLGERKDTEFRTVRFSGSDHILLLDHDAPEAVATIRDWLAR